MLTYPYDRPIAEFIRSHVVPRSRVLDVGCGSGWATLILTGRTLRCETACVDRDARAITFANRALRRRGREIRCRRCYAENLGDCFKPGRFDAAVAVHALHHFDEPARALRQMRKVLKPGGQLALAELDPTYGEELDDCPRYSLMKIMAFVRAAGFKQVRSWHQRPGVLLLAACR